MFWVMTDLDLNAWLGERLSRRVITNPLLPGAGVSDAGRAGVMELRIRVLRGQGLLNLAVCMGKTWGLQ